MARALSPSMRQVLRNVAAGLDPADHARGQAQHGGVVSSVKGLQARGLVEYVKHESRTSSTGTTTRWELVLTDAGREEASRA